MNEHLFETINVDYNNDNYFNNLYPPSIQALAPRHWTPAYVTKKAISFLASEPGARILDIGSGAGKFCLAGGYYAPHAHFSGIEQRDYLIRHARYVQKKLGLTNVSFIEGNLTGLPLKGFDHFYLFNPFFENLDVMGRIDEQVPFSVDLYEAYVHYLKKELRTMPVGTKVVTYHSLLGEIPEDYELLSRLENGDLKFWMKK